MSTSKKYGNWALIAVVMLLFGTAIATIQFKVPVVMGDIMANMGMDASSASWLMSIFTFVGIILALPTGALAKRFGPKTMLLAAAAIIAVGSLLGAFAGNGMVLIVSRAIEGVAFIFVTICGPLAVQKYVAPDKIGSATGIWALWVCLGSVVGGVLTPTLYASTGFVGVWVIYAAAAVVFAIVVAVIVKNPSEALEGAADAPTERKVGYGELVKPNILLFFFAFLPQFTSPKLGSVGWQTVQLGAVFMLATLLVFGAIAFFSGAFGELLQRSVTAKRWLNRVAALVFVDELELFGIGFSWGGYESLVQLVSPKDLSHHRYWGEGQNALVRLHIGLESPQDIIADLTQALEKAAAVKG